MQCKQLLDKLGGYQTIERGPVNLKVGLFYRLYTCFIVA